MKLGNFRRPIAVILALITIILVFSEFYSFIARGGLSVSLTGKDLIPCIFFSSYSLLLPTAALILIATYYRRSIHAQLMTLFLLALFVILFAFNTVFAGFAFLMFAALAYSFVVAWFIELILGGLPIDNSVLIGSIFVVFVAEFFLFVVTLFIRTFQKYDATIHSLTRSMFSEKKPVAKTSNAIVFISAIVGYGKIFFFSIYMAAAFATLGEIPVNITNLPLLALAFLFTSVIPRLVWRFFVPKKRK